MRLQWVKMTLSRSRHASGDCHASAASSHGRTSWYQSECRPCRVLHSSHVAVCWWLWSPSENDITIVHPWRALQRRGRVLPQTPHWSSAEYVGSRRRWWKQVALTLVTCFSRLRPLYYSILKNCILTHCHAYI